MNNLESFTDFHKRKRKDCIDSLENFLKTKHMGTYEHSLNNIYEKETILKDVLADLMHWAKANKVYKFDYLLERAKDYFEEEWKGDWEEWNDKQEGEQSELALRDKNGFLHEDFISEDE